MSKPKLDEQDKKVKISVSIDKKLIDILDSSLSNKSKYVEQLIRLDLIKNNKIEETMLR